MLIGETLRASAERSPDKIAVVGSGIRLSYAELDTSADQLANALLALRLGTAAKVAVLSTNRPEYAIAYFGIARTDYISVHCSTRSTAADLAYVLRKTGSSVLFAESRFLDIVTEAIDSLDEPVRLYLLDDADHDTGAGIPSMRDFAAEMKGSAQPAIRQHENDGLAITLTGGTTGLPKAVLVSHKARHAAAQMAVETFGLSADDVMLASTPLFHTVGLFVWFGVGIALGATIVLPDAWSPETFLSIVPEEGITAAFLVPSQLNALVSHPDFAAASLKTLKHIGYAGAPMGRALFERVQRALPGVTFTENYGQSEACPLTVRREEDGEEKIGTVGRAVSNTEVAIVDADDNFIADGTAGNIVVRGDTTFAEYFNDPAETEKAYRLGDGWLLTGDVGFLDADGFLTLVDRSKDMLISGGENVYPTEIENALYQHDAVNECAVIGVPDDHWGEVPAAFVVLADGAECSEDELITFCAEKIARFKRPRIIEFVASLPKTTVGKIRKNVLREPYWKDRDRNI